MHFQTSRRGLLSAAVLAVLSLQAPTILAQSAYPNKPIKLIVAFPPGGTSDVMARLIADALSKDLGQQFIVDNVDERHPSHAASSPTTGSATRKVAPPDS